MNTYRVALWTEKPKGDRRPMVTGMYYELEVTAPNADRARVLALKKYPKAQLRSVSEPIVAEGVRVMNSWATVD